MRRKEADGESGGSSPKIVVGGVIVSGGSRARQRRKAPPLALFRILAAAVIFLGTLILASGILSSCSAGISAELAASGRADIRVAADLPLPLAQKLRRLSSLPEGAPLFDLVALRASLSARPGLSIASLSSPSPESLRAQLSLRSLAELLASPDIANPGIFRLSKRGEETELRIRLERGQGRALSELLPGLDPYLIEALAPPALEEEPLSAAEYRQMLASIFGEKLMPALEAASISIRIGLPGKVSAFKGGVLEGRTLVLAIPLIDLLVLEKPLEYSASWKGEGPPL